MFGDRGRPFARARAMFALIGLAMQEFGPGTTEFMRAMAKIEAEIGPYKSHGKGRGGRMFGSSSRCVAMDKRDARKARNQARHKRAVKGKR